MRDFGLSVPQPPGLAPSEVPPQPAPSAQDPAERESLASERRTQKRRRQRESSRKRRAMKGSRQRRGNTSVPQSAPLLSGVSTPRAESDNDNSRVMSETQTLKPTKKRKKYSCRDKTRGKLKAILPVGGSFRQYIVRQSGRQRMIIGSKIWAEKRKKKQALKIRRKASGYTRTTVPLLSVSSTCKGTGPLDSTICTSPLPGGGGGVNGGAGDVHHMQTLFQDQLDSAMADKNVNASDDIDLIFSNL